MVRPMKSGSRSPTALSRANEEKWSTNRRTWTVLIVVATGINLVIQWMASNNQGCASPLIVSTTPALRNQAEEVISSPKVVTVPPEPVIPAVTTTTAPPTIDKCQDEYERITADRTDGLTREDLKRSDTFRGNRHRLAQLGQTLSNFKENPRPINMVVAGGSITMGHGVEIHNRYSNRLEKWLNDKYPGPKHTVFNKGGHGADICAMAKRLNILMRDLPNDIDLFVLEFAVNDYQGQDHQTQIDFKMDVFFEGFQTIAMCTETVVYKLLRQYPKATILFLEMRTAVLQRKTASLLHMGAAQQYQVPVISYDQALFPDYQYLLQLLKPYNYSTNVGDTVLPYPHGCHPCQPEHIVPYFRQNGCASLCILQRFAEPHLGACKEAPGRVPCTVPFFAHDEVHPSGIGHQIVTDLIIDRIATTARDVCNGNQELERMALMPSTGWMVGQPALLDAQSAFLMVNDTYEIFVEKRPLEASVNTTGFTLYADAFGREGWIATNEAGGESVSFEIRLPLGECYVPYLSILKSYENMGTFTATVLDRTTQEVTTTQWDGLWAPRISVPSDAQLIPDDKKNGCTGNCQVTVTTDPQVPGRGGNKVKIVTLSVRRCIQ